jgi:hypothetical protein
MTTLRALQAQLLGRYVQQAFHDVADAVPLCRELRDTEEFGGPTLTALRRASEDLDAAKASLDSARRRLNLHAAG